MSCAAGPCPTEAWGHDILVAADAGKLAHRECSALMVDYLVPSLDTTISGIASTLALFATHPNQWELLRAEPALVPNVINEVLHESPLCQSPEDARPTVIADVAVPAGAEGSGVTHRRTAMSESGRSRILSIFAGMRTASWDSGMVPMCAPVRRWLVWRCRRCSARCLAASSGSNGRRTQLGAQQHHPLSQAAAVALISA